MGTTRRFIAAWDDVPTADRPRAGACGQGGPSAASFPPDLLADGRRRLLVIAAGVLAAVTPVQVSYNDHAVEIRLGAGPAPPAAANRTGCGRWIR